MWYVRQGAGGPGVARPVLGQASHRARASVNARTGDGAGQGQVVRTPGGKRPRSGGPGQCWARPGTGPVRVPVRGSVKVQGRFVDFQGGVQGFMQECKLRLVGIYQ